MPHRVAEPQQSYALTAQHSADERSAGELTGQLGWTLWGAHGCSAASGPLPQVIDPYLGRHLRPHQSEGVRFMYECVMGLKSHEHAGCILADEMGLG